MKMNPVAFSLLFIAIFHLQGSKAAKEVICDQQVDVAIVFELPSNHQKTTENIADFFNRLVSHVQPNLACIRISFIIAEEKVNVLTRLNCSYVEKACLENVIEELAKIESTMNTNENGTQKHKKEVLQQAIETGYQQLSSTKDGARKASKKSMVLILNNPPVEQITLIRTVVEKVHRRGIELLAIGVDEGKKENLENLVNAPDLVMKMDSLKELTKKSSIWTIDFIVRSKTNRGKMNECSNIFDIGFLLDSSNSIRDDYQLQKLFIEKLATRFGIEKEGSHAGVIVFSAESQVQTMIRLDQYYNIEEFREAVAKLPFFGYVTRIDLALKVANNHLFTNEAGARPGVKKLLFLITDGRQNPPLKDGRMLSPMLHAKPLHDKDIRIYAIGIGDRVNLSELSSITRSRKNVYTFDNIEQLLDNKFIDKISNQSCNQLIIESKPVEQNANLSTSSRNATDGLLEKDKPDIEPEDGKGTNQTKTNDGVFIVNNTSQKLKCEKDGTGMNCDNEPKDLKKKKSELPENETTQRFEKNEDCKGKKCSQCNCCCEKTPINVNIYNGGNNFIIQSRLSKPAEDLNNDCSQKRQADGPKCALTPSQISEIVKLSSSTTSWSDDTQMALKTVVEHCLKNKKEDSK